MTELYDNPKITEYDGAIRYYRYENNYGARVDAVGGQYVVTPIRWTGETYEVTGLTRVTRATLGHPAHVELSLRQLKEMPSSVWSG